MSFLGGALAFPNSWGSGFSPGLQKGFSWHESWNREAVTPTGFPTIYTEANTGGGSGSINTNTARSAYRQTTGAAAGDDVDLRTSGLKFYIAEDLTYSGTVYNTVTLRLPFDLGSVADGEMFIGIINSTAAITALPTTATHMGLYVDISAGANFMFTEANGAAQTTTDTTVAADTSVHVLEIKWNASVGNTLSLYSAAGALEATRTTVRAQGTTTPQEVHWFTQAEAGGARTNDFLPWSYSVTP